MTGHYELYFSAGKNQSRVWTVVFPDGQGHRFGRVVIEGICTTQHRIGAHPAGVIVVDQSYIPSEQGGVLTLRKPAP